MPPRPEVLIRVAHAHRSTPAEGVRIEVRDVGRGLICLYGGGQRPSQRRPAAPRPLRTQPQGA